MSGPVWTMASRKPVTDLSTIAGTTMAKVESLTGSRPSPSRLKRTVFTNGPYAEMLYGGNFMPEILDDGTRVFAAPLGKGHVPIITLPDLGYFARYIFDHPVETAGKNLEVASDYLAWSDLAAAFTKVTGLPAIYQPVTYSQWIAAHPLKDAPVAVEDPRGMSFADNFRAWWKLFEDDVCTRDMEFCRRLHPKLQDIETR